ncbi:WD40 repeat-like protein [Aspergillus piperis CBS 112811]|uniref:WD40 repeat-like protein n=1 Tax=Aspergillus piperis CBS 112811 TaxID=1448313 RepID=A0A8G1R0A6_9EURO|nr:WD40 repeat-like protein [Aspergillus piperis CBS 112811]RAH57163.1 WD40 repeat-like protein [Aspergillus piperis CBS 112811]
MGCPKLRNPFRKRRPKQQPREETTNLSNIPPQISFNALSGTCSTLEPVAQPKPKADALPAEDKQVQLSSDTILPHLNRKTEKRNLWQEAYNTLDEKQRQNIKPLKKNDQNGDNHDDNATPVRKTLDDVIRAVKAQYEIRMSKRGDSRLRDAANKILTATLSCKDIISAIVAFDPTAHASSAWTVVSLGLTMTQNYRDQQMAWFQSSAILTDILARYAVIEKLYRDESSEVNDRIEDAILRVYIAVLKYTAEAMTIYRSNTGKRLMRSVVALANLPLTEIQSSIDTEETHLGKWLQMFQEMQRKEEANNILLGVDRILDGIRGIDQKLDLAKLPIAEGAHFNSHMDEDQVECLENTRVELLDDITDWVDDPKGKTIFWLRGVAGTGKSTISRSVARKLHERDLLGASFFYKRGEGDRGKASRFITTIVKQLMIALPHLRKEIAAAMEDDLIVSTSLKDQFDHLLLKPLLSVKLSNGQRLPLVIVVDALDECEERSIETIIRLLPRVQESKTIQLKVFITSRPEHPIFEGFEQIEGEHKDVVLHEIERRTIKHDMALFFEDRLSKIRKNKNLEDEWPGETETQALIDMAIPLFIFAETVCRLLGDYRWDPDDSLKDILKRRYNNSNLDRTYLPVLDKLLEGQDRRAQNELVKQFRQVVGTIVALESPLSIASLSKLINMKESLIRTRLDSLHSVLSIPKDNNRPVRMFHLSFREFRLHPETKEKTKLSVDGQSTHRDLAHKCIAVMMDPQHGLRQDICDLRKHGTSRDDITTEQIEGCFPAELRYSTRYWVRHLHQGAWILSDHDEIHEFLKKNFLHWLEAMSILGHLPETIGSVNMLLSIVQTSHSDRISKFLYDAKRLTLKNIHIAKEYPLQLYSSALLFAPEKCTIKKTFLHYVSPYFSRLSRVPEYWGAELQTIEVGYQYLRCLEFSPDGELLLTSTNKLSLWEASTGDLRHTLEESTNLEFGLCAFSPDGKLVAGTNWDSSTIRLWDSLAGTLRHTLKGEHGTIAIGFLNNEQLVSISFDRELSTWNTISGELQQSVRLEVLRHTLKSHGRDVLSLAFSPDGRFLASAHMKSILVLWDICKGTELNTLQCHANDCCINSVDFSHNGRSLALYCEQGLTIWDICHSPILSTFASRKTVIGLVKFSPDNKLVASSTLGQVTLWDTTRCEVQHAPQGHTKPVTTVQFSQTGAVLASSSRDSIVRLWDISTGTVQRVLQGHSDAASGVSISPKGHLVAVSSKDGLIEIWDVSNGTLQHNLSSNCSKITNRMLFSPDESLLLVIWDSRMFLWDAVTGTCKWTVEPKRPDPPMSDVTDSSDSSTSFGYVETVAFSPSGNFLAAGFWRKHTVRLWNIGTGMAEHVFTDCSTDQIQFSPDGKLLAAGSVSTGVKVWRVSDGGLRQTLEKEDEPSWFRYATKSDGYSWLFDTNVNEYRIHPKSQGNIISVTVNWIGIGKDRFLWIPPEYRGNRYAREVIENTVILGLETGDVIFMGICPEKVREAWS